MKVVKVRLSASAEKQLRRLVTLRQLVGKVSLLDLLVRRIVEALDGDEVWFSLQGEED